MRKRWLALLLLMPLVAACGDDPAPTSTDGGPTTGTGRGAGSEPAPALDGRTFVATGVTESGADRPLAPGTELRLEFTGPSVVVSTGCNSLSGPYTFDGRTLVVEGLAGTEMGCDQDLVDQDAWISEVMTSRPEVTLDGDTLVLTAGETVIALTDREAARPDSPLTGTTWTLDSLIEGDVVSSVPAAVAATITFATNGSYRVSPGCNRGGGRYEVSGATIDIEPPATTRMSCGAEADTVERAVLGVLSGPVTFEITEQALTLTGDGVGLGFRA